ncbi:hypothetical protein [Paenibacillus alba]|uniref:Uncharacterized protein n=1 Tax=Paenibacillus alba TaxID=1197127 RepID=A0ABU6G1D4_9BACL|nr:hypothetical protein [Paenibacillus alba]MEC0227459.1 hypothetical protein [Paenibacillus alba]NQX66608.1 hypothetical protein [Paenibacillus alba]
MNSIFMLSFVFTFVASLLIDRRMLKQEKKSVTMTYGVFMLLSVVLFVSKYMHWPILMPSRFFIHTVSPWFIRIMGI